MNRLHKLIVLCGLLEAEKCYAVYTEKNVIVPNMLSPLE